MLCLTSFCTWLWDMEEGILGLHRKRHSTGAQLGHQHRCHLQQRSTAHAAHHYFNVSFHNNRASLTLRRAWPFLTVQSPRAQRYFTPVPRVFKSSELWWHCFTKIFSKVHTNLSIEAQINTASSIMFCYNMTLLCCVNHTKVGRITLKQCWEKTPRWKEISGGTRTYSSWEPILHSPA